MDFAGSPAILEWPRTGGFASPPRGGFAQVQRDAVNTNEFSNAHCLSRETVERRPRKCSVSGCEAQKLRGSEARLHGAVRSRRPRLCKNELRKRGRPRRRHARYFVAVVGEDGKEVIWDRQTRSTSALKFMNLPMLLYDTFHADRVEADGKVDFRPGLATRPTSAGCCAGRGSRAVQDPRDGHARSAGRESPYGLSLGCRSEVDDSCPAAPQSYASVARRGRPSQSSARTTSRPRARSKGRMSAIERPSGDTS